MIGHDEIGLQGFPGTKERTKTGDGTRTGTEKVNGHMRELYLTFVLYRQRKDEKNSQGRSKDVQVEVRAIDGRWKAKRMTRNGFKALTKLNPNVLA